MENDITIFGTKLSYFPGDRNLELRQSNGRVKGLNVSTKSAQTVFFFFGRDMRLVGS